MVVLVGSFLVSLLQVPRDKSKGNGQVFIPWGQRRVWAQPAAVGLPSGDNLGSEERQAPPGRPPGVLTVWGAAAKSIKGLPGPGPGGVSSRAGATSEQPKEGT